MTFTRREQTGVFTAPEVLLLVPEIHHACICTWVPAAYRKDGKSRMTLKYRNSLCPAATFHRRLASTRDGTPDDRR
ncbi:MAG TPA: hypothetical protein VKU77_26555 [Streptosporangiaceae bacterium]|nr:hypothetical protein [Streptosporangiaceae bacterium]